MSIKRTINRILGKPHHDIDKMYDDMDYLDAYSLHTDLRVEKDPQVAIGGMWEEIGELQFDFLVNSGMKAGHKMLDIGCGTLRGGRHFINYLEKGNYHGMDISAKAIEAGKELLKNEGLTAKTPVLLLSEKKNLKFEEFQSKTFDFILAQSVFTHLMPAQIEECFANIGKVMLDNSAFFFTYNRGEAYQQTTVKDFVYPLSFFEDLSKKYSLRLEDHTQAYDHPRSQNMLCIKRN